MKTDAGVSDAIDPEHETEMSFAETALKLGGKSDDEARRTGAIDTADDQVEGLFASQYQTVNSPAHRAVWDRGVPTDLFSSKPPVTPPEVQQVMDRSLAVVSDHARPIADPFALAPCEAQQTFPEDRPWRDVDLKPI